MRSRFTLPALLLGVTGLSAGLLGCKASVEAELNVTDLREQVTRPLIASAHVHVDGCERISGGSEEPGSLDWTQWVLSGVFPDTRYRSCDSKAEGGVAFFRNMVLIDGAPDEALTGLSHVNIKVGEQHLGIGIPPLVQEHIERVRGQVGNRSEPAISTALVLINDSDAAFDYRVAEGLEGDELRFGPSVRLEAGKRSRVELPEAFATRVLEQGRATALRFEDPASGTH
ncbi:hypothetical protein [Guyparkeria sp.]|uniref:hypothetical protein n=1 Tax=Guyparkeria sp. TaxID=2035736 RepID=UPI00397087E5